MMMVMAKKTLTQDEKDIRALKAAVKKIRSTEIPHVISEDRWTARPERQVKGIVYNNHRSYDWSFNLYLAIKALNPKSEGLVSSLIRDEKKSKVQQWLAALQFAWYDITRYERNRPDAEVDGNLVHWMEHAMHIALWSPVVTAAVAEFLEAEMEARKAGHKSPSSDAAVALAREINKKKVWDTSERVVLPKPTLVHEVAMLVPSVKAEAVRRMRYMVSKKVDHETARSLYIAYGHQPAEHARKNAERMLGRAQRAVESTTVKATDKRVWKARVKACEAFLESLEAQD